MRSWIIIALFMSSNLQAGLSPSSINVNLSETGVISLNKTFDEDLRLFFDSYSKSTVNAKESLHFYAQEGIDALEVKRIKSFIDWSLQDFKGSNFGHNKQNLRNILSSKDFHLFYFKNKSHASAFYDLKHEDINLSLNLFHMECPKESSVLNSGSLKLSAMYSKIIQFLFKETIMEGNTIYTERIKRICLLNKSNGNWIGNEDKLELYFSDLFLAYYDLPTTEYSNGSFTGREWLKENDPLGYRLISQFFPPYLSYQSLFKEVDLLYLVDNDLPFLNHLSQIKVNSSYSSEIRGNDYNNIFTGNSGNDDFQGFKGNDLLNGEDGFDRVYYQGSSNEYQVFNYGDYIVVNDMIKSRDDNDTLLNIEEIVFTDKSIGISDLALGVAFENDKNKKTRINSENGVIYIDSQVASANVRILDINGKLITSQDIYPGQNSIHVQNKGLFFVLIEGDDYKRMEKTYVQ